MFDAFWVVANDTRGQFINTSEIDALAAMVSDSNKRLDAVNRISSNASSIVASAARQLFAQQPSDFPRRNAYTSDYGCLPARHNHPSLNLSPLWVILP